jgi:hypothetical protein
MGQTSRVETVSASPRLPHRDLPSFYLRLLLGAQVSHAEGDRFVINFRHVATGLTPGEQAHVAAGAFVNHGVLARLELSTATAPGVTYHEKFSFMDVGSTIRVIAPPG